MTDDELLTLPLDEIAARCPRLSQREDVGLRLYVLSDATYRSDRARWHEVAARAGDWLQYHWRDFADTLEAMDAIAEAVRTVAMASLMADIVAGRSVNSSTRHSPCIEAWGHRSVVCNTVSWDVMRRERGREAVVLAEIEGDRHEVAPLVLAAIVTEVDRD